MSESHHEDGAGTTMSVQNANGTQSADAAVQETPPRRRLSWWLILPVAILAAGLAAFIIFDLGSYFSYGTLRDHRASVTGFVDDNYVLAALAFILVYIVVVAFSLPVALYMSVIGGFLFGSFYGTVWIVIGATIGATAMFLIARTTLGRLLRAKAGGTLKKMEAGFRANEWSYMFVLRLVPLFPFYLVNLVPAFLGVRTFTFVVATFFGIMPGAFVLASFGGGADALLEDDMLPGLDEFLRIEVAVPIVGLVILSLIPILYRRLRARRLAQEAS